MVFASIKAVPPHIEHFLVPKRELGNEGSNLHLPIEPGEFSVMDRGYVDFARLLRFTRHSTFFVTRANRNLDDTRRISRKVDKTTGTL